MNNVCLDGIVGSFLFISIIIAQENASFVILLRSETQKRWRVRCVVGVKLFFLSRLSLPSFLPHFFITPLFTSLFTRYPLYSSLYILQYRGYFDRALFANSIHLRKYVFGWS